MEEADTISNYYTSEPFGTRWQMKLDVQKEFDNKIESGDKVYFLDKPTCLMSELDLYLSSIGVIRVKKQDLADKIVNGWDCWYRYPKFSISSRLDLMSDIPQEIYLRHKSVFLSKFTTDLKKWQDDQRIRIEFDYSMYETLWGWLESKSEENIRLAAGVIMTIDWKDEKFLLDFLIQYFCAEIKTGKLGSIPGWSTFANINQLCWKNYHIDARSIVNFFKMYKITSTQFTLIHKLLNNN